MNRAASSFNKLNHQSYIATEVLTDEIPADYRAVIHLGGSQVVSPARTVSRISASVSTVTPVFERESAVFGVTLVGPGKPTSVFLVHKGNDT